MTEMASSWGPQGWVVIIGAVFLGLTQLISVYYQKRAAMKSDVAAEKADVAAAKTDVVAAKTEEVKVVLESTTSVTDKKLDSIAKTTESVHQLVNSAMSAQLKIAMIALHRVAELTNNPDDVAAAQLARSSYDEHQKKQAVVDSMSGKPPDLQVEIKKEPAE